MVAIERYSLLSNWPPGKLIWGRNIFWLDVKTELRSTLGESPRAGRSQKGGKWLLYMQKAQEEDKSHHVKLCSFITNRDTELFFPSQNRFQVGLAHQEARRQTAHFSALTYPTDLIFTLSSPRAFMLPGEAAVLRPMPFLPTPMKSPSVSCVLFNSLTLM